LLKTRQLPADAAKKPIQELLSATQLVRLHPWWRRRKREPSGNLGLPRSGNWERPPSIALGLNLGSDG
jgi:hypothetical protein